MLTGTSSVYPLTTLFVSGSGFRRTRASRWRLIGVRLLTIIVFIAMETACAHPLTADWQKAEVGEAAIASSSVMRWERFSRSEMRFLVLQRCAWQCLQRYDARSRRRVCVADGSAAVCLGDLVGYGILDPNEVIDRTRRACA